MSPRLLLLAPSSLMHGVHTPGSPGPPELDGELRRLGVDKVVTYVGEFRHVLSAAVSPASPAWKGAVAPHLWDEEGRMQCGLCPHVGWPFLACQACSSQPSWTGRPSGRQRGRGACQRPGPPHPSRQPLARMMPRVHLTPAPISLLPQVTHLASFTRVPGPAWESPVWPLAWVSVECTLTPRNCGQVGGVLAPSSRRQAGHPRGSPTPRGPRLAAPFALPRKGAET